MSDLILLLVLGTLGAAAWLIYSLFDARRVTNLRLFIQLVAALGFVAVALTTNTWAWIGAGLLGVSLLSDFHRQRFTTNP